MTGAHRLLIRAGCGLSAVAVGVVWIAWLAATERAALDEAPLRRAAIVVMDVAPLAGAAEVRLLPVPESNYVGPTVYSVVSGNPAIEPSLREAIGHQRERVYFMDASSLEGALASGRMPEPGAPELLAGALASLDAVDILGTRFTVTGRLAPSASGFATAYVLPEADSWREAFAAEPDARRAWFVAAMPEDGEADLEELGNAEVVYGGLVPSAPAYAWQTMAALVLIAAGGAAAQFALLHGLAALGIPGVSVFLDELRGHGTLAWTLTAVYFGLFFFSMTLGLLNPSAVMYAVSAVRSLFAEGDLAHIGAAYESGDVLHAAFVTWVQNFFVATVLTTLLASMVIPFFGVFKNALTFFVVGFALAPLWTGSAENYVFHAITMTLELQVYVFASFAAVRFPLILLRGAGEKRLGEAFARAMRLMGGAALFAGIQLAIAGLYEAATLIALHRG